MSERVRVLKHICIYVPGRRKPIVSVRFIPPNNERNDMERNTGAAAQSAQRRRSVAERPSIVAHTQTRTPQHSPTYRTPNKVARAHIIHSRICMYTYYIETRDAWNNTVEKMQQNA